MNKVMNMEFRGRAFVAEKGCLNGFINPSRVCVNLGEAIDETTQKRKFYGIHDFPDDCSEFECPEMMPIEGWWRKELKKGVIENV